MKKIVILSALMLGVTGSTFAQNSEKGPLTISGYAEAYYLYDFNNPINNTRPAFAYSHNRNNEFNINLAFVKAAYHTERIRSSFALATGTYMNANYAAEPGVLKNIYEANIGVRLSKNTDLWVDAGVLPSHIGFESAVGKDNWTLTRSLFADNSPYFETGVRVAYTSPSGKWFISGSVLNGWQRIQRIDGNSTPAFGHQLTYKPNDKLTLNSSSFIGNDKPDSTRQMRYFHNFYAIYQFTEKVGLTAGFDIGAEQKEKGSSRYNTWYTPVLVFRYSPTEKCSIAARGEYYQDKNGVIIATHTPNGFQSFGFSINADYYILPNVLWRIELRNLHNQKDAIYLNRANQLKNNSFMATSALAISF